MSRVLATAAVTGTDLGTPAVDAATAGIAGLGRAVDRATALAR